MTQIPEKNLTPAEFEKIQEKLLHYVKTAIHQYQMIKKNDRVMVCLSGGKDSFTLLWILNLLRKRTNFSFELFSYTLDQQQPGWDDSKLRNFLDLHEINYLIESRDTYSIVMEKIPEGKTYCSLCSRLRRGNIYRYAEENNFNKVALGHHRDDLIETLLMSIFYSGQIKSMPPKLKSDNNKNIIIRPLALCQESDIIKYANYIKFPIIPCNLCGSQEKLARVRVRKLIKELALENPKIPSNILHALQAVQPSQLMDKNLWDFENFINLNPEDKNNLNKKKPHEETHEALDLDLNLDLDITQS